MLYLGNYFSSDYLFISSNILFLVLIITIVVVILIIILIIIIIMGWDQMVRATKNKYQKHLQ